jgi:hydrogenase small subunit
MRSKPKLLWIDAVSCNGCSHSFFNIDLSFLDDFELLYHPLLPSGDFEIQSSDILIVEGAIKPNFLRLGFDLNELISKLFFKAKTVIALGTCAVYGGIFGEGLVFNKTSKGKFFKCKDKVINIPGCPVHPEWLFYVLNMLKENKKIILDEFNRPVEIFSYTSHMGCVRNEYFEWKIDAERFGEKEGCLFYYFGCQGPFTHSSCNKILWNEVNSKPRAGTPCFGCTEPLFPKENLFQTETFMGIPANIPLGVSKRAYLTLSGIAKSLTNERLTKKLIKCEDEDKQKNN